MRANGPRRAHDYDDMVHFNDEGNRLAAGIVFQTLVDAAVVEKKASPVAAPR